MLAAIRAERLMIMKTVNYLWDRNSRQFFEDYGRFDNISNRSAAHCKEAYWIYTDLNKWGLVDISDETLAVYNNNKKLRYAVETFAEMLECTWDSLLEPSRLTLNVRSTFIENEYIIQISDGFFVNIIRIIL